MADEGGPTPTVVIQKVGKHSVRIIVTPDASIITQDTFALAVHCVQKPQDVTLTLGSHGDSPIKVM